MSRKGGNRPASSRVRLRSSGRQIRLGVSHHRTSAWQPPTKDEDLLFEEDLGAPPRRKKKKRKKR